MQDSARQGRKVCLGLSPSTPPGRSAQIPGHADCFHSILPVNFFWLALGHKLVTFEPEVEDLGACFERNINRVIMGR